MATTLEVYEDRLRTAGAATDGVRDRVLGVLGRLQTAINGRGEPWGGDGDTIGHQFASGPEGYLANRDGLIESTTNIAGTFGKFSDAQYDAADEVRAMEDGNRDQYT